MWRRTRMQVLVVVGLGFGILASCTALSRGPNPSPRTVGGVTASEPSASPCQPAAARDFIPLGTGIGSSDVFAVGFGRQQATLRLGNSPRTSLGWRIKVLLVARPRALPVTIVAYDLETGEPIWLESPPRSGEQHQLVLRTTTLPKEHGLFEFPSHFFIPEPGCYRLTAAWRTGGWTADFVVRR